VIATEIDGRGQSTDEGPPGARMAHGPLEGQVVLLTGIPGLDRQRHDTSRASRGEEPCGSVGVVIVGNMFDAASMVGGVGSWIAEDVYVAGDPASPEKCIPISSSTRARWRLTHLPITICA
jgi:hypothetical protein